MNAPVKFRIKGTRLYVEPRRARAESVAAPYEGASQGARLANWKYSSAGPNNSISSSLGSLRPRSRDMVRKNGLADSGIETLVSQIVGTGIKPQFNTADTDLNREVAKLWTKWTDEADANGEYDFYGLQALAVRSMLEAGDVFGRLRPRLPGDVRTVPLQVQLLESEFCPVEKSESLGNGNIIHCGIQFDAIGRKTAYWMYPEHPDDPGLRLRGIGAAYPIPAGDVVQLKHVRRPGMIRGEPWLARAIVKLYDLDKYDDAQLVRQQIAAMFAGFVSPDANGRFGYQEEANGDGVALASLEPGTLQVLEPGATMNFSNPPTVGDSYEAFMSQQHHYIAGAMGILYEQLTGDFSKVNDRTWRAAMNGFKRKLERWQHQMLVFQFCRPILQRWVDLAIVSGKLKLPRGIDASDVAMPKWVPQAQEYINPVQDVEAKRAEIRAGFTSRSQVVSENGYDAEVIDDENKADNDRADGLGLTYESDGRQPMNSGAQQPQDPAPQPAN